MIRSTLREMMIAEGIITPAERVRPPQEADGLPFLALDGAGARAARRAVAGLTNDERELYKTQALARRLVAQQGGELGPEG